MAIYWSTYMVQWNCTPRREFHRGQEIVEMLSELGVEAGWKHWNKVVVSKKAPTHAKYDQNGLTNAKWWFSLGRYIIYSGHFAEYNGIFLAYNVVLNIHGYLTAFGIPPALWPSAYRPKAGAV